MVNPPRAPWAEIAAREGARYSPTGRLVKDEPEWQDLPRKDRQVTNFNEQGDNASTVSLREHVRILVDQEE